MTVAGDRPDPGRRWLIPCGVGTLVGLLIAGFGLFTAQGTRIASVPPQDAALVNGVPILRSNLIEQLRALDDVSYAQAGPARRRAVLGDMIREELYVQRGIEMGLANDDIDVRGALAAGVRQRAIADTLATSPSPAALHDWYDRHPAAYADEGVIAVGDPATPSFYPQARARLGAPLFAAASAARAGASIGDGDRRLTVALNRPPARLPFDAVRQQVLSDYLRARAHAALEADAARARSAATIVVAPDLR